MTPSLFSVDKVQQDERVGDLIGGGASSVGIYSKKDPNNDRTFSPSNIH